MTTNIDIMDPKQVHAVLIARRSVRTSVLAFTLCALMLAATAAVAVYLSRSHPSHRIAATGEMTERAGSENIRKRHYGNPQPVLRIRTLGGSYCVMPFHIGDGVQRMTCTTTGREALWCATTDNYMQDKQWDYCECRTDYVGRAYGGSHNVTIHGTPCEDWSHVPADQLNEDEKTIAERDGANNYCRNHIDYYAGPYCFKVDAVQNSTSALKWSRQPCAVPYCLPRIKYSSTSYYKHEGCEFPYVYKGITYSTCLTRDLEGNWCPVGTGCGAAPYCDVAYCECKTTLAGFNYRGVENVSRTGLACLRWDLFDWPRDVLYRGGAMQEEHNYCRNPSTYPKTSLNPGPTANRPFGPWCYTSTQGDWDYCEIQLCSMIGKDATIMTNRREKCKIPFHFENEVYTGCTFAGSKVNVPWCYTNVEQTKWDYCY